MRCRHRKTLGVKLPEPSTLQRLVVSVAVRERAVLQSAFSALWRRVVLEYESKLWSGQHSALIRDTA